VGLSFVAGGVRSWLWILPYGSPRKIQSLGFVTATYKTDTVWFFQTMNASHEKIAASKGSE